MTLHKYYCTRGWKDGHMGTLHPFMCKNEEVARNWMWEHFGADWCTSYTEEHWLKWVAKAQIMGVPLETEQPLVTINE